MKNNVLSLLALTLLFSVIACSSPATEELADAADENTTIEITSRSLEPNENSEEDMHILLVQKWESESGEVYLDLKIDGSFEGKINGEELVFGTWDVAEDQKTLTLKGNQPKEGKGESFNASYEILEMSFDTMKVKDQEGNEIAFSSATK